MGVIVNKFDSLHSLSTNILKFLLILSISFFVSIKTSENASKQIFTEQDLSLLVQKGYLYYTQEKLIQESPAYYVKFGMVPINKALDIINKESAGIFNFNPNINVGHNTSVSNSSLANTPRSMDNLGHLFSTERYNGHAINQRQLTQAQIYVIVRDAYMQYLEKRQELSQQYSKSAYIEEFVNLHGFAVKTIRLKTELELLQDRRVSVGCDFALNKSKTVSVEQLKNSKPEDLRIIGTKGYNELISSMGLKDASRTDLIDVDFFQIGSWGHNSLTRVKSIIDHINFKGIANGIYSENDIFNFFTDFSKYENSDYREFLKTFKCHDRFMIGTDIKLKTDLEFSKKFHSLGFAQTTHHIHKEAQRIQSQNLQVNNSELSPSSLKSLTQDEVQQIRVAENTQLTQELKNADLIPLSNDLNHLKDQCEEQQKHTEDNGHIIQRKAACISTLENPSQVVRSYDLTIQDRAYLVRSGLDPKKFETCTGNIVEQQIHYEHLTVIKRAAKLDMSTNELCKNLAHGATNFSCISANFGQEKQYAKSYIFADAANSLLDFGENVLNNFKMQGEGAYNRLLEEIASAKQFYDKPQETLTKLAKDYYNVITSVSKAIGSFAIENIGEILNPVINERKIELAIDLTKEIAKVCKNIADKLSDMSPQELNKAYGYLLTDITITSAKTKGVTKIATMSAPMLKASITRGKQALDNLGVMGQEIAEIAGIALQKGVRATETVLDLVRHNPELAAAEGGVAKFVHETFEKEKHFIKKLTDIKLNRNLSKVEKVSAQASLLSSFKVKNAAENVAKHFGTVVAGKAKNGKGWIINITKNKKNFTIRIMDAGSGQRVKPYFRVIIPDKPALTLMGKFSIDEALTHIDLTGDYLTQIDTMINNYK